MGRSSAQPTEFGYRRIQRSAGLTDLPSGLHRQLVPVLWNRISVEQIQKLPHSRDVFQRIRNHFQQGRNGAACPASKDHSADSPFDAVGFHAVSLSGRGKDRPLQAEETVFIFHYQRQTGGQVTDARILSWVRPKPAGQCAVLWLHWCYGFFRRPQVFLNIFRT